MKWMKTRKHIYMYIPGLFPSHICIEFFLIRITEYWNHTDTYFTSILYINIIYDYIYVYSLSSPTNDTPLTLSFSLNLYISPKFYTKYGQMWHCLFLKPMYIGNYHVIIAVNFLLLFTLCYARNKLRKTYFTTVRWLPFRCHQ